MTSAPTLSFLLFFFFFFSSCSPASAGLCNKYDKKALLKIKSAFNNAYHFASWTNDSACCDWYNIDCDARGRVIGLSLFQDDFPGTIPDAVGDLPFLQSLTFHHLPNLVGTIPPAIARLANLRFLDISWTSVSGPVPAFLARLRALDYLNLSFNNLSGTIPAALGDAPSLTSIDISRNKLTGPLPPALFRNASEAYLRLSHNGLSGEVPPSYGSVRFIQVDLSRNQFEGDATFLFGRGKPAQQIDLSRNKFEFDLTRVEFPEADLILVDLNHNKIYGNIPQQISEVGNLQFFNVSYNRLCGKIPAGGRLNRFDEYCFLHNKCLCGAPLPAC
ncbi:polygalacturonase inhibitor-like [Canna indica]|uniref:Polygalacturonase inhibitor-like n=1 Tax=Canna indica TaxID=4628 RepID=A0AAQ3QL40_9LILI|nr:polygalacturonase inhibitor-like [Canna indica]